MQLTLIAGSGEIRKRKREFFERFEASGTEKTDTVVGYPGGSISMAVYWNPDLHLWMGTGAEDSHCWNPFGTSDPGQGRPVSISNEINFPRRGLDRRIGGAFAQDSMDMYLLSIAAKLAAVVRA